MYSVNIMKTKELYEAPALAKIHLRMDTSLCASSGGGFVDYSKDSNPMDWDED